MSIRKILILFLILSISLFGIVPVSFAAPMPIFAGGTGTEEDPWQIATADQLDMVRYYVGPDRTDNHFILIADINLNVEPYNLETGWLPLGDWNGNSFQGTFDGAGHTISGLHIDMPIPADPYNEVWNPTGLFSETTGATIKNLNLVDADVSGYSYVGTIVGHAVNTSITNVSVSSTLSSISDNVGGVAGVLYNSSIADVTATTTVSGSCYAGGAVGDATYSTISNLSSTSTVTGDSYVGGLVGIMNVSLILDSESTGVVTGSEGHDVAGGLVGGCSASTINRSTSSADVTGTNQVGGLIGDSSAYSTVANSFASGAVTSNNSSIDFDPIVGGLVGYNTTGSTVKNCYAVGAASGTGGYIGGVIGSNYGGGPIVSSYSLGPDNGIGTVVTEGAMKTETTFVGWNFEQIWGIDEGVSYPYLLPNVTDFQILSLRDQSPQNVAFGSAPYLPKYVLAELDDATTVPLRLTWDEGTPTYDGSSPREYIFTGTIIPVDGITNTNGITANISVTVLPQPKQIISVGTLPAITVPIGTDLFGIQFPQTVLVTLQDVSTAEMQVTWDGTTAYNGNISGTYALSGSLGFDPLYFANPNGYRASVNVIVADPNPMEPVITSQPQNQTVSLGETATFIVGYDAYPEATIQWQLSKNGGKKWGDIIGATSAALEVAGTTLDMDGYQYRAILNNGVGASVISNAATLSVVYGTADVGISQEGSIDAVTGELVWTITVTNYGPDAAQEVEVTDKLINGTKVTSVISDFSYNVRGKTVIINVGTLEVNETTVIEIRALVTRATFPVMNTATVTAKSLDEDLTDNSCIFELLAQ